MTEKTIVVDGWFGDKTVNREQFIAYWTEDAQGLQRLSWGDAEWTAEVQRIVNKVEQKAGERFDTAWLAANK